MENSNKTTPARILVYSASGLPVKRGDVARTFRDEAATVDGWIEPHTSESTGRVLLRIGAFEPHAYFPSVINSEWRATASQERS